MIKQLLPPPVPLAAPPNPTAASTSSATAAPSQNDRHLASILQTLALSAAAVDEHAHAELLRTLFSLSLWTAPAIVADAWIDVILHFVSVKSALLQPCVRHLVEAFSPPPAIGIAAAGGPAAAAAPLEARYTADAQTQTVHAAALGALARIVALRPLAAAVVRDAVCARMPHRLQPRPLLCAFMRATLLLAGTQHTSACRSARKLFRLLT